MGPRCWSSWVTPVVMVASRVAVWRPPRLRAARPSIVGQVEEAAAPGRVAVGLEQAPADVGVQRRDLDAQPPGRLLGREHPVHPRYLTLT